MSDKPDHSAISEAFDWLNHATMCDLEPDDVIAVHNALIDARAEHQYLLARIAKLEEVSRAYWFGDAS